MRVATATPRRDRGAAFERLGFTWAEGYWDESRYYEFSLAQIEDGIEAPTEALMGLCYEAVGHVVEDGGDLMARFQIPEAMRSYVRQSWWNGERDLYGRFDFSYDGRHPAKLLEFNADTPTSLYEAAVVQWQWLDDLKKNGELPAGADQFNSIHEKLIEAFKGVGLRPGPLHLAGILDSDEDAGTLAYLADVATQAGLTVSPIDMAKIGVSRNGFFTDEQDLVIANLFKLYPWEMMFREEFARHIPESTTRFIEPAWKAVLSNKALLPVLWQLFPGHPNLLEAYFEDDPRAQRMTSYARKPLFSREGANVELVLGSQLGRVSGPDQGYGAEGYIRQQPALLPEILGKRSVIGSWVVAGQPAGMSIRESADLVTTNTSQFVPHVILN